MKTIFMSLLMLLSTSTLLAHGGKNHKKDSVAIQKDPKSYAQNSHKEGDTVHHHAEGIQINGSSVTARLSDFPSIHPLIVHFAIGFIVVAAAIQLLNVILLKKEIAWIIGALLFLGFLAAWFAAKDFHPHTHGISEHAQQVLDQHDKWADWTIYSAICGLIIQAGYLIFIHVRKGKSAHSHSGNGTNGIRGFAIVAAVVMLSSAYCVARAGHYGAQLVHIEGIGPQGKYLEMEHSH